MLYHAREGQHTQNIQINTVIGENEKCGFYFTEKIKLFGQPIEYFSRNSENPRMQSVSRRHSWCTESAISETCDWPSWSYLFTPKTGYREAESEPCLGFSKEPKTIKIYISLNRYAFYCKCAQRVYPLHYVPRGPCDSQEVKESRSPRQNQSQCPVYPKAIPSSQTVVANAKHSEVTRPCRSLPREHMLAPTGMCKCLSPGVSEGNSSDIRCSCVHITHYAT